MRLDTTDRLALGASQTADRLVEFFRMEIGEPTRPPAGGRAMKVEKPKGTKGSGKAKSARVEQAERTGRKRDS